MLRARISASCGRVKANSSPSSSQVAARRPWTSARHSQPIHTALELRKREDHATAPQADPGRTSETSPSPKTTPPAEPATDRSTWPPYAPRSSTPAAAPATSTSPKAAETTPAPPKHSASTAWHDKPDNHGTRRSPGIGGRGRGPGMAHLLLHKQRIHPILDQMRDIRMPQAMH